MQKTNIGWTDYSINLLKYLNADGVTVWGCVHASEGCRFCYAEALAKRWGRGEAFTAENMKKLIPYFDVDGAKAVLKHKGISGKKVFVDDMTDLFGEWVPDAIIIEHFKMFVQRPDVTFQVLTKRAQRLYEFANAIPGLTDWPNVHIGVSVEDQKNANSRIPLLLETPATVRWVSVEPLLSPVNLNPYLNSKFMDSGCYAATEQVNGIVIGGESGAGHREMPITSAVNLARDANRAGVAVYFKQDSGPRPGMQGRVPDDVWSLKQWPEAIAA